MRTNAKIRFVLAVIGWVLAPGGLQAQSHGDWHVGIKAEGVQRIPLSILPFEALDGTSREDAVTLEQIVLADLDFSGLFKIIHGRVPLTGNGDSEGLIEIRGTLALHRGQTYFEGRVIDAGTGRSIGGKRYTVKQEQLRQIAHHFSDEVIRMLTGDLGIASTSIVFRRKTGEHWELVITDYDGYNPRVILRQTVPAVFPRWIDKSTGVVFTSYRYGKPDLFRRYLRESKSHPIASFDGANFSCDWSEKREELVATLTKDGNAELYLLDRNGKVKRRLTHSRAIETSPSWSPSGREILFTSDRVGSPHIFIMEANGSNVRRVTSDGRYNASPAWSPKGDRIAFVTRIDGFFQVCTIRPDGSDFEVHSRESVSHEDPRWAPNGRHLVYTELRGREESWITIIDTTTGSKRRV